MQLVGALRLRPHLRAHRVDGGGVERAEIGGGLGIEPAARQHRLRAPLLERRVVEERVRPGVERLLRERRRFGDVASEQCQLSGAHAAQQILEMRQVHRLFEAVGERLLDQRMIGHLAIAGEVLGAGELIGKHHRHQVVGVHALELRRHAASAAVAQHRQRAVRVPAPAHAPHRRVEQRLHQHVAHGLGVEVGEHLLEREAVGDAERQHDGVLGGGGLQLEVELAAEALAQREAPGAVEPAAVRRVQHQLHAAALVEEALEHQRLLRRHHAERALGGGEVLDRLPRGGLAHAGDRGQPGGDGGDRAAGGATARGGETLRHLAAQVRHRARQLLGPRRRLAQPERDRGRRAARVLHPHLARLDLEDAPRGVAELEDVAGHALDREVLVDAADADLAGLEHHVVVGGVGDGAAVGDGGEPRAAPRAQPAVDAIVVQIGAAPAGAAGEPFAQHGDHFVEGLALEIAERPGPSHQIEQLAPRSSPRPRPRPRSAAPGCRAAAPAPPGGRARRARSRAPARWPRPARRARAGRAGPWEWRPPRGRSGRRAAAASRSSASSRADTPGRRCRCRCRARARRWRPARAARRP